MFITLTIATNKKPAASIKMQKSKLDPKRGWKKTLGGKKRSMWSKIGCWNKNLKSGVYKLEGNIAMF